MKKLLMQMFMNLLSCKILGLCKVYNLEKTTFMNLHNLINSWVELLLRSESNLITLWLIVYLTGISDFRSSEKVLHSNK